MPESNQKINDYISKNINDKGVSVTAKDVDSMRAEPPKETSFPVIMLTLAIIKDVLDAFTLTGVGYLLSFLASFFIGMALFLWLLNKGGGAWKARLLRKLMVRFGVIIVLDAIPGLNLVPAYTVFIILTYYREKKVVKLFWEAVEVLEGDLNFDLDEVPVGGRSKVAKARRRQSQTPKQRRAVVRRQRRMERVAQQKNRTQSLDGIIPNPA